MSETAESRPLRGYVVSGECPEEGAVLVFDYSARKAKARAWPFPVHEYDVAEGFIEVRVKWLKDSDPKSWGVTEPCTLEPAGCERCELWKATPLDVTTGLCDDCLEDEESWAE